MELWIGHAKKASTCHYCGEFVRKDDDVIQGRTRRRRGHPWPPVIRWHLDCWIASCRNYLSVSQVARVVVSPLGRPRTVNVSTKQPLDEDDRKHRSRIVHHFNVLLFRRRALVDQMAELDYLDYPKLHQAIRLLEKMRECAKEISQLGGMPATWQGILGMETGNDEGYEFSGVYEAGAAQV